MTLFAPLEIQLSKTNLRSPKGDLSLTGFAKKVYKVVLSIPVGKVRTYKWVAKKAGHPKAYRAVGSILKKNPCPLIIPCHRVVKSVRKPRPVRKDFSNGARVLTAGKISRAHRGSKAPCELSNGLKSNYDLGGYVWGRRTKKALLDLERQIQMLML